MDHPINDIFEGVGDLLLKHGNIELSIHNVDENSADIYIEYGGYKYHAVYIDGVLYTLTRIKRRCDHGQDQG